MLYEKLNAEMQETVDQFAERLRALPWNRRSDLLAEAGAPFAARFQGEEEVRLASRGFVTAVLERLAEEPVDDPYQATLYHLSLNPHHRELAAPYLEAHPEIQEMLDAPPEADA